MGKMKDAVVVVVTPVASVAIPIQDSKDPGAAATEATNDADAVSPLLAPVPPTSPTSPAAALREAAVEECNIEDIFQYERWNRFSTCPRLKTFLFLLLWTPFGAVLFFLRLVVLAISLLVISKGCINGHNRRARAWLTYFVWPFCGVFLVTTGKKHVTTCPNPKVLVSNHASNFDPLFCVKIGWDFSLVAHKDYTWFWDSMQKLGLMGKTVYTDVFADTETKLKVRDQINEELFAKKKHVLIYPEGTIGSPVCIMQYQQHVFSLGVPIVPLCLRIWNPWPFHVYATGLGSVDHLLWFLFLPFVVVSHTALPPVTIRPNETPAKFATRVQLMTAKNLKVGMTALNLKDKYRFMQAVGQDKHDPRAWSKEQCDKAAETIAKRGYVIPSDLKELLKPHAPAPPQRRMSLGVARSRSAPVSPKSEDGYDSDVSTGSTGSKRKSTVTSDKKVHHERRRASIKITMATRERAEIMLILEDDAAQAATQAAPQAAPQAPPKPTTVHE